MFYLIKERTMKEIKISILLFIVMSLLTGVFYPMAVTVLAQAMFPRKADGNLLYAVDGTPIGSAMIGQPFSDPKYFWSRPSATAGFPYNASASGGSNLGPTNKDFLNQIADRVKTLKASGFQGLIPPDMVTASGSGLDPHISTDSALLQIPRIARERHLSEEEVKYLVQKHVEDRQFGFLGAQRVNVLKLNLSLDKL
jgi:K+-transporting ATPase ATPase C chain